jgi:hypothetical protein
MAAVTAQMVFQHDDAEVRTGVHRWQQNHRAHGRIAPWLLQHQPAQPVEVLPAVLQALRHGLALDEMGRRGEDSARLTLGVDLHRVQAEDVGHAVAGFRTPAASST